jgi:hypothetical protein
MGGATTQYPALAQRAQSALIACLTFVAGAGSVHATEQIVIKFADAEVGKPMPSWSGQGVTIEPAGKLNRSKAAPRVMFFPHLKTEKRGILSAMAAEAIPVQVRIPNGASRVTLVMWGSITSSALVEALDEGGNVIDAASLDQVPRRKSPADPIPSFELAVEAPRIAAVRFGGAKPGGFLATEEIRITPILSEQAPAVGAPTTQ